MISARNAADIKIVARISRSREAPKIPRASNEVEITKDFYFTPVLIHIIHPSSGVKHYLQFKYNNSVTPLCVKNWWLSGRALEFHTEVLGSNPSWGKSFVHSASFLMIIRVVGINFNPKKPWWLSGSILDNKNFPFT